MVAGVTGRKRYQTSERGVLPHFELTSDDRIKVNPLAYFSDADVVRISPEAQLARASALCQRLQVHWLRACTSMVAEGEDPRAGWWRGLNKKECGIRFDFSGAIANPMTAAARHTPSGKTGLLLPIPSRNGPKAPPRPKRATSTCRCRNFWPIVRTISLANTRWGCWFRPARRSKMWSMTSRALLRSPSSSRPSRMVAAIRRRAFWSSVSNMPVKSGL